MNAGTAFAREEDFGNSDSADRILKIVSGLQQKITDQEIDFQLRLKHAVEENGRRLERELQAGFDRARAESHAAIRREVTEELVGRFDVEMSKLQSGYEKRLSVALDAEASVLARLEQTQQDFAGLDARAKSDVAEWRVERQSFLDRIAVLERELDTQDAFNTDKLDKVKDIERKLEETLLSKAQLAADLQRAVAELSAHARLRAEDDSDRASHGEVATIVQCEMARVQLLCENIEKQLADPCIDLAAQIRLHRERWELEAYLKGLRYSLGEVNLESAKMQEACGA